ncbi:MAG TPA: hypothetical protein VM537_34485 [Anaerolineae bacterium]|nr:hypothetical protein [Anaerolineae bacterium]
MMFRSFSHTCGACHYLGTHQDMYPPLHGSAGPFLVPRVDFYRCTEEHRLPLYSARYGNGETDLVCADSSDVDDWRLVPMIRNSPDGRDENLRMMIKIIRLLDRNERLSKGYALVRLEDMPTDPFLLTVPFLMPHEERLMLEVAPPLMARVRGRAREKGLMRALDEEIERRVIRAASDQGYITIWNQDCFVPPQEDEEEKGPPN